MAATWKSLKPAFELMIIGGAGIGRLHHGQLYGRWSKTPARRSRGLQHKVPKERQYLDTLAALQPDARPANKSRNEIESHIDNPEESSIFQSAPTVTADKELTAFICDYVR